MASARPPSATAEYTELFVNPAEAAATSCVLEAVAGSHSVLLLHAVATSDEAATIVAEAGALARAELESRAELEECGLLDEVMESDAGRVRMPIARALGGPANRLCDALCVRALAQLVPMRDAATHLGTFLTAPSCIDNPCLSWSPGEPAVNFYTRAASSSRTRTSSC